MRENRGAENASKLTGKCKYEKCEYVPVNIFVEITVKLLSLCQMRLKQLNKICNFLFYCKMIRQYTNCHIDKYGLYEDQ